MPKFTPSHVLTDGHADDLPFGDVFDVPRLSALIKAPVIEWRDVKDDQFPVVESMGCWAVWPAQQQYEPHPREGWFPRKVGLGTFCFFFTLLPIHCSSSAPRRVDVSYTTGPPWLRARPTDKTALFWDLARLSFPDARRQWLHSGQPIEQTPSPILNVIEDPSQQMLCMDYLFYVGAYRVRCRKQAYCLSLLTSPSSRKSSMRRTILLRGDLSPPICTGPHASRPLASFTSGMPLVSNQINRSHR
jgi:hypothetical protein